MIVPSEPDRSHITCSKCKKTGHYANKCPVLFHNSSSNSSTAEVFPEHSVSSSYVPPEVQPAHAVPTFSPESQIVLSPTEEDAILKMHWLGIDMAEASQPIEQLHDEDWHIRSDRERASAISFWDARRQYLRQQIAEASTAIPSIRFSESFTSTGVGPVYAVRAFPPHGPGKNENAQLH